MNIGSGVVGIKSIELFTDDGEKFWISNLIVLTFAWKFNEEFCPQHKAEKKKKNSKKIFLRSHNYFNERCDEQKSFYSLLMSQRKLIYFNARIELNAR